MSLYRTKENLHLHSWERSELKDVWMIGSTLYAQHFCVFLTDLPLAGGLNGVQIFIMFTPVLVKLFFPFPVKKQD